MRPRSATISTVPDDISKCRSKSAIFALVEPLKPCDDVGAQMVDVTRAYRPRKGDSIAVLFGAREVKFDGLGGLERATSWRCASAARSI